MGKIKMMKDRGDQQGMLAVAAERSALMKKHNVSLMGPLLATGLQMPVIIFFFSALRKMTTNPELFDGLATGGIPGWCLDLTVADPTYALPLSTTAIAVTSIWLNPGIRDTKFGTAEAMKKVFTGLSLLFLPVQLFFPAGMTLSFFTTSVAMLIQTQTMRLGAFKRLAGVPDSWPHVGPVEAPRANTALGVIQSFIEGQSEVLSGKGVQAARAQAQRTVASGNHRASTSMFGGLKAGAVPPPPPRVETATVTDTATPAQAQAREVEGASGSSTAVHTPQPKEGVDAKAAQRAMKKKRRRKR
jgi:hypothetical protein